MAAGTIVNPFTLEEALTSNAISAGDTVYLRGGIYSVTDRIVFPDAAISWRNYPGERPVVVHTDGEPPGARVGDLATVSGLWFGGSRPAADEGSRTIVFGQNATVEDCTIFNYLNGFQLGSDAHGNTIRRNRFLRCGYGTFLHPLYVANSTSSLEVDSIVAEENIIVASEGYSIHFYHEPSHGVARYNFAGNCLHGLAIQGDLVGPSADHNIIWGATGTPLYHSSPGECDSNVWQGCSQPNPGARTFDDNRFVEPVPTAGTNPVTWQEADVQSNLGNSTANIDAAISALDTAFQQTTAQIQADGTIEAHFATLKAVIDTWKANTT